MPLPLLMSCAMSISFFAITVASPSRPLYITTGLKPSSFAFAAATSSDWSLLPTSVYTHFLNTALSSLGVSFTVPSTPP